MDARVMNEALRISMEWGPRRSIPFETRVTEACPELTPDEIEGLRKLASNVESDAWGSIVPSFKTQGMKEAAARTAWESAMRTKWPWLDEKNLTSGWTQGCYYAWKDGELA